MKPEEIILKILKTENKPLKVGEIERMTGIDRNTVQKVINQLEIEGMVNYPDRCHNKVVFKGGRNVR